MYVVCLYGCVHISAGAPERSGIVIPLDLELQAIVSHMILGNCSLQEQLSHLPILCYCNLVMTTNVFWLSWTFVWYLFGSTTCSRDNENALIFMQYKLKWWSANSLVQNIDCTQLFGKRQGFRTSFRSGLWCLFKWIFDRFEGCHSNTPIYFDVVMYNLLCFSREDK